LEFEIFLEIVFCFLEIRTFMLIKKQDSIKKENSENCTVWEYDFPNESLGLATCRINGRYPAMGKAVNMKCDEIYYVISGKGVIHHESGDFEIKKGDAFYFEKDKWYWVEGEELIVVVPTAPKWFFEQYKYI